jgi:hypothetical protein
MVNSVPYDTIFFKPVKNTLAVKLKANTFAAENLTIEDASATITPLFEVFGSAELASIARHDTVGGVGLNYELTSEIDDITKDITAKFLKVGAPRSAGVTTIDISKYISAVDLTDPSLPGILIDENGDLIINLIKLEGDEGVDVQALSGGTMVRVTYGMEE